MKQIRETSDFVCAKMLSKVSLFRGMFVLEPSIGEGKIIEYLIKQNQGRFHFKITGVELNDERYEKCKSNLLPLINEDPSNDLILYKANFLTFESNILYDAIIACPPFKDNVDLLHIRKMYEMLRCDGILVSLTSPYWITNNESHQIEFRNWLKDIDYQFELLPDNTFMEKGKNVPTGIITING